MMDDLSIVDDRLHDALADLARVNRWLGGHYASVSRLRKIAKRTGKRRLRILDLAAGASDYPIAFVRWGERAGVEVHVTAVDANDATCEFARRKVAQELPAGLRERVHVTTGDALASGFDDGEFDVVHAALFAHHLDDEEIVRLLTEMNRMAGMDIILNDLHRHPVAYHAVRALGRSPWTSEMFEHDGPVSVLRGFTRADLLDYSRRAGLPASIDWFIGFRWLVTRGPSQRTGGGS
jgi:SAM-dependent methyltransferase